VYGSAESAAGSIATVIVVFLFCGVYSIAWTPLATSYPPEILNYTCRTSGMAAFSFTAWSSVVFISFVFPFGLQGIGWKFYIVNAGWDVLQVDILHESKLMKTLIIFLFYEETLGKTLEAIDEVFDGIRHTEVTVDVYKQFVRN
jgi:Sugar (and other) transporter